jgi:hypothetical protein
VIEGPADRTGAAVRHLGGKFSAHAVDARLADAERRRLRGHSRLTGGQVRLAQLAPLRVFRDQRGAVARYLACGVRRFPGGGERSCGPAGGVTGLLRLGARGLAPQGFPSGAVKAAGQRGGAGAGGRGGLVLLADLAGDGAQCL